MPSPAYLALEVRGNGGIRESILDAIADQSKVIAVATSSIKSCTVQLHARSTLSTLAKQQTRNTSPWHANGLCNGRFARANADMHMLALEGAGSIVKAGLRHDPNAALPDFVGP